MGRGPSFRGTRNTLARAPATLPKRQRAAIAPTELLGHSSEEVGRILGVKDVTERSLSSRARSALRTHTEGVDA